MAKITEDYVSFETAKLLKEKKFDAETDTYYSPEGKFKIWCPNGLKSYLDNNGTETWWWKCIAPTKSMAMKWLREVHDVYINIIYNDTYVRPYEFRIIKQHSASKSDAYRYITYEECVEKAIEFCLENLI